MRNTIHPVTEHIIQTETSFWNFCKVNGFKKSDLNKVVNFWSKRFPTPEKLHSKVMHEFADTDYWPIVWGSDSYLQMLKNNGC